MTQKRFGEMALLKIWIAPAATLFVCATGFVGGVLAEKNIDPNKSLIPENVYVYGVIPTHAIQGAVAIAMYSWLFSLSVVDAERKRARQSNDVSKNSSL